MSYFVHSSQSSGIGLRTLQRGCLGIALFAAIVMTGSAMAADTIPQPASDAGFESTHFSGSSNCGSCHNDLLDEDGIDVSIEREWSGSMMALSARDPVFHAKFSSELKRNPELSTLMSETCLRCHAPMARVEADYVGDGLTLLDNAGILDPANPYHEAAMDGVSCTVCHQIEDAEELGELGSFSGGFEIPTVAEQPRRLAFGPFVAPRINPMLREIGFEPRHSDHVSNSALCGTCHNLNTPIVDGEGQIFESHEFPEQAIYSEWEQSDFADDAATPRSCQDCHMESADGVAMANRPVWLAPVDDFRRHRFLGANTVVLAMINSHRADLGVATAELDDAIAATREFLQGAAEISIVSAERSGGELEVEVEVINKSGHKLPTGYPARRIWIDFQVIDKNGKRIFRSGRMKADGNIAGVNSDRSASRFEPHFKTITRKYQVQVYESVMGDADGELTHTLLRADHYLKDNRIPPAGFDKNKATDDVAVVGHALNDSDFEDGRDRITYRMPVPESGRLVVKAVLRYQPLSAAFLNDLFRDADLPLVARLKAYWEDADLRVETLAKSRKVLR